MIYEGMEGRIHPSRRPNPSNSRMPHVQRTLGKITCRPELPLWSARHHDIVYILLLLILQRRWWRRRNTRAHVTFYCRLASRVCCRVTSLVLCYNRDHNRNRNVTVAWRLQMSWMTYWPERKKYINTRLTHFKHAHREFI